MSAFSCRSYYSKSTNACDISRIVPRRTLKPLTSGGSRNVPQESTRNFLSDLVSVLSDLVSVCWINQLSESYSNSQASTVCAGVHQGDVVTVNAIKDSFYNVAQLPDD